jgi:predicted metal-dependent hydrolase
MTELEYQIVRSPKRKKLTIMVERDRTIIVHAPQGISEEEVRRVVDAKRQWILAKLRHPQKYQDRLHPPGKEVVNGESAPYLGKDYRIEVTETASGEMEFSHIFLVPAAHQAKRREVRVQKGSRLYKTQKKLVFCPTTKRLKACATMRVDFLRCVVYHDRNRKRCTWLPTQQTSGC